MSRLAILTYHCDCSVVSEFSSNKNSLSTSMEGFYFLLKIQEKKLMKKIIKVEQYDK